MNALRGCVVFFVFLFVAATETVRGETEGMSKDTHSLLSDTVRLFHLKERSKTTFDTPDELRYLDTIETEARYLKNIKYQTFAFRNRVRHYFNADDLENAQVASEPAIRFLQTHKLYPELFEIRSMVINLYTNRQKYELSIHKGYKMYEEAKALNNDDGKIAACYSLAYACYVSKRYAESVRWSRQGISLTRSHPSKQINLSEFYFLLSESLFEQNNKDTSIYYVDSVYTSLNAYTRQQARSVEEHYSYYLLWMYCRHAMEDIRQNNLGDAKINLDRASKLLDNYQYDIYKDLYYFTWSDYYRTIGDYENALFNLDKGFEYLSKWFPGEDPDILDRRSVIYAEMGQFKKAANLLARSTQMASTHNQKRVKEQSEQLRSIYEVNRLEEEGNEHIFVIYLQIILVLILCMLVLYLGYLLFRYWRIKQKWVLAVLEAQAADSNTSNFLKNLRTEVQVFLQEISGLSDSLIKETDPGKRQDCATHICTRNEKAQRVIFEILDVSKIESDRMQFHYDKINLNLLMPEIEGITQYKVSRKIPIKLLACQDISIQTDPERLYQIVVNIILYLSARDAVFQINFGYRPEGEYVRFFVSGEGWMMPESEQKSVFDRLAQTSGRLEEMNLGMVICKGLVKKMKGCLSIKVDPQAGTCFEITFPVDESSTANRNQ